MSVNVKMTPKSRATSTIGRIIGSVIVKCVRQKPLPSTAAASGMSRGIDVRPASRITVANGQRAPRVHEDDGQHRETRLAQPHRRVRRVDEVAAASIQLTTL